VSACLIKKATRKPLVLDFRDAWALNPHANYGERQRKFLGRLEEWVVRTCDALILNTPGAERSYRGRYPEHAAKMTCIPNGFDSLNVPSQTASASKFTIMHVGDFYRSRNPTRLLQALANIGNRDIEFVQVGPMFEAYSKFKDTVSIRFIDRVAHAEALRLMQSASVLYLSQGWEPGVTDYIAVASKTYEYLATGLPILADCPPGDNADVVRQYASRAWVLTCTDVAEVEAAVHEAYTSRHMLVPEVTTAFVETFGRERLAGLLSDVLEKAVSGSFEMRSWQRYQATD
jgi:glycosyltransferase involved in cell wall biosynthesis